MLEIMQIVLDNIVFSFKKNLESRKAVCSFHFWLHSRVRADFWMLLWWSDNITTFFTGSDKNICMYI